VAVDGAFKTPILRNAGLTAPYMHNGGQGTLAQVIAFYNRGGDRRGPNGDDTTGFDGVGSNLDPDIDFLNLTDQEQADLLAFLLALTDQRVACERAPFDHPQLTVPNGHVELDSNGDGRANDINRVLPAVGRGGLPAAGLPCLKNSGNLFDQ
jgi:hypothetical protein